jgi:hypothetical protein
VGVGEEAIEAYDTGGFKVSRKVTKPFRGRRPNAVTPVEECRPVAKKTTSRHAARHPHYIASSAGFEQEILRSPAWIGSRRFESGGLHAIALNVF